MHPKLEAALATFPAPRDVTEALRLATARGLLAGYHQRWVYETWQVEAVEHEFHIPIVNPATNRRTPLFTHAGKFDGLISREDGRYLLEHKTCSEDLSPSSAYWKRLTIDTQISGYLLASWLSGQRLNGVLYDVIRKPEIRPKKLGLRETSDVRITSTYLSRLLSPATYQAFSLDSDRRETPEMFEARLVRDTLDRPDWYFGRSIICRLDKELLTYAHELWQSAHDIRQAQRGGDLRRNDKACFAYFRPCEFLDLCAGHDRPDSSRWKHLPTLHPELEDPTCGPNTLTHTRLSTFVTCRRKHHYRYELGLAPAEEAEALVFGDLIHRALAAWWQTESPGGQL